MHRTLVFLKRYLFSIALQGFPDGSGQISYLTRGCLRYVVRGLKGRRTEGVDELLSISSWFATAMKLRGDDLLKKREYIMDGLLYLRIRWGRRNPLGEAWGLSDWLKAFVS